MAIRARGEVWLVDLGLAAKVRPSLVLSIPYQDEDRALITVVPHTTSPRHSRFEVEVNVPFLQSGAFDVQGMASIPNAKFIRRVGILSSEQMFSVEEIVRFWLGL